MRTNTDPAIGTNINTAIGTSTNTATTFNPEEGVTGARFVMSQEPLTPPVHLGHQRLGRRTSDPVPQLCAARC